MYADKSKAPQALEGQQAAAPAWSALAEEMKATRVWISSSGLSLVDNATTVRVRNGKTLNMDDPFAETHEQLGGYFLLDCKDLDEAIRRAEKIPTAKYGSIEVRPLWSQNS